MKKFFAGAAVALCVVMASPVLAQSNDAPPSSENLALARRVVAITTPDYDKMILAQMQAGLAEARLHEADPEIGKWMDKNAGPILLPHMRTLLDQITTVYAQRFTTAELEAMLAFYESPMGRVIAGKALSIGVEVNALVNPIIEAYATELLTRMCGEFDCGEGKSQPAARSKSQQR